QSGRALVPNAMQLEFISNLSKLCERQVTRAMLISATGTGKTYAAAFAMRDAKGLNPRRILFLVHRAQIALQAQRSFERVLGARYSYGQLSGTQKETDKSCLFATIQTMSKADVLKQFHPDCFDVIIIDESHRSGAGTYQKVMEYFKPRFWLGMTATPERSDGFNVFELFDHNIAHEIRLEQALKADMLCPFHYFGIADVTVNGQVIEDKSPITALTDSSRVDHILRETELRGYSGNRPRGLIFCSSTEECRRLSEALNDRNLRTAALSGKSSRAEREEAVRRLAQIDDDGCLDYILTVDIFNEGIDIPEINQIIMLRPTQSAIIFVQQLGRGLRKCEGKDFVVVLDFIGNYKNSFLIPIALSGDNSFDKDSLRRFMMLERKRIPGASTVQFDRVAKERIFDAIDHANTESMALLRESYKLLRQKLGRIPTLVEFDSNNAVDPVKIFKAAGSYHAFKKKVDPDYTVSFDERAERLLSVLSRKLGRGIRVSEAIVLEDLLNGRSTLREHLRAALAENEFGMNPSERHLDNVMDVLANRYFKIGRPTKTSSADCSADYALIEEDDGDWRASRQFEKTLAANPGLREQIKELTAFIRNRYKTAYSGRYKDTDLVLYEKYSYEEVGRLLNWNQNITPQSIGGYFYDRESGTLPVFINYEKTGNAILYEDRFVSEKELIAVSKTNVTPKSRDADHIYKRRPEDRDNRLFLFVRRNKNDNEAKAFYFLGEIRAIGEPKAVTLETGERAFEIQYKLETPVRQDIYQYLTEKSDEAD
ncbi:MAG: DUF3427 domain-containing protein, partial [Sutterella sp.]|nr:DUF3427 domain-containing protein [Sutterella sp.]